MFLWLFLFHKWSVSSCSETVQMWTNPIVSYLNKLVHYHAWSLDLFSRIALQLLFSLSSCLCSCVALYWFMYCLTEMLLLLQSFHQDCRFFFTIRGAAVCPTAWREASGHQSITGECACVCKRERERESYLTTPPRFSPSQLSEVSGSSVMLLDTFNQMRQQDC